RVLLKGLRPDPKERHPSMGALLEQLSRDPRVIRTRALALGSAALFFAVGVVGYRQLTNRQVNLCKGAAEKLSGICDEERKQIVTAALLATQKPYAADTARSVQKLLDNYARAWVEMQTDACLATRVRGEHSEAALDLRTDCLRRRLEEMKALTDLFVKSGAQTVEKAVEAAQRLPSLHQCADVASLSAPIKLPQDPAARADVLKQRTALAQVHALRDTGRYKEGLALAVPIVAESRRLAYKPLEAETMFAVGDLEERLGDSAAAEKALSEAAAAAEVGRDDKLRA